jgi:hypothetical protein
MENRKEPPFSLGTALWQAQQPPSFPLSPWAGWLGGPAAPSPARPSSPLPRAAHLAHPARGSPTPKTLGRALPQPTPQLSPSLFSLHPHLSSLCSHRLGGPCGDPTQPVALPLSRRRARPLAPVAGAARRPYGSRARPPASHGGMGARRSRPGRRPRPRRLWRGRVAPVNAAPARARGLGAGARARRGCDPGAGGLGAAL